MPSLCRFELKKVQTSLWRSQEHHTSRAHHAASSIEDGTCCIMKIQTATILWVLVLWFICIIYLSAKGPNKIKISKPINRRKELSWTKVENCLLLLRLTLKLTSLANARSPLRATFRKHVWQGRMCRFMTRVWQKLEIGICLQNAQPYEPVYISAIVTQGTWVESERCKRLVTLNGSKDLKPDQNGLKQKRGGRMGFLNLRAPEAGRSSFLRKALRMHLGFLSSLDLSI